MYAKGYLPTTKKSHKTIVEFTKIILGHEYDSLVGRFNRLRRKRHDFIYDFKNHITHSEARSSLDTAKKLIGEIVNLASCF
jgi:hypothetical protein